MARGLWRFAARPSYPHLSALAIAYIVLSAIVIVANGKAYYVTPIYPALFAAGGVAWEAWLERPAMRWIAVAVVVIPGLYTVPTALPILSARHDLERAEALRLSERPRLPHAVAT